MTRFPPTKGKANLIGKKRVSSDVYELSFEMIEPNHLNFIPGQYISIEIDTKTKRQYSLSTSPTYSVKKFQIIVDTRPNGVGVKHMMKLDIGDTVNFIGQIGLFTLPDILTQNLYFISTNTGIAPLKSMIEYLIDTDTKCNLKLIYGTRYRDGVLYEDLFTNYFQGGKLDQYEVTFSKENIKGYGSGYVTQYVDNLTYNDKNDALFFICGSGSMIESVSNTLRNNGYPDESIYFEKFY